MARLELALEIEVEAFQCVVDRRLLADLQTTMVEELNAAGKRRVMGRFDRKAAAFYKLNR